MSAPGHAIFISYGRRDSICAVDRLDERLKQAFGTDAVFRDVRSIRKGQSFPDDIRASLQEAAVGLVVSGAVVARDRRRKGKLEDAEAANLGNT